MLVALSSAHPLELSAALGVPVVIDNRSGASSIIGVQEVARA